MNQHAKVKIAILRSLKRMPKTYTMRDEALRAEVCLDVQPRPTLLVSIHAPVRVRHLLMRRRIMKKWFQSTHP